MNPACPMRMGNSVTRHRCPDISLVRNSREASWENLEETLGSDHCLLCFTLLAKAAGRKWGQAKLTNWHEFRLQEVPPVLLTGSYMEWAKQITALQQQHVTNIQTTEKNPTVDKHLMHIWEARRSLTKRWNKQKPNRKLRARISVLIEKAAKYAVQISDANWIEMQFGSASNGIKGDMAPFSQSH
ncbi:hypothetical protein HPB48_014400 [Haemaphysalis longicornis]|uniref:Uncharacterized protein n=1 Tax=Haemaphysalis longicornis TaxID=44386 RepID=A0A9J6G8T6_HAELO|nr:hypothetical protein HPB48_014400 [Haemaphysalis longicornis]